MIDVDNYKRVIAWLRRTIAELSVNPEDHILRLGVLHCFEVTHNISEAILREGYVALEVDEQARCVSLRELLRRAAEEGLRLSTPKQWLEYGLVPEAVREDWMQSAGVNLDLMLPILPQYAEEIDSFARTLETRMARLV